MQRGSFSHKNYGYSHHDQKGPSQAIDVHDIFVKKSKTRVILSYVGIFVFLANACYSLLVKVSCNYSFAFLFYNFPISYSILYSTFSIQLCGWCPSIGILVVGDQDKFKTSKGMVFFIWASICL